mmetsp:Transcript_27878/g.81948  ORF Transcript_27878/g.81948 Transcript_27878/m.81948 type:complete len:211 (+) Transcript_27878:670-1302(+)
MLPSPLLYDALGARTPLHCLPRHLRLHLVIRAQRLRCGGFKAVEASGDRLPSLRLVVLTLLRSVPLESNHALRPLLEPLREARPPLRFIFLDARSAACLLALFREQLLVRSGAARLRLRLALRALGLICVKLLDEDTLLLAGNATFLLFALVSSPSSVLLCGEVYSCGCRPHAPRAGGESIRLCEGSPLFRTLLEALGARTLFHLLLKQT